MWTVVFVSRDESKINELVEALNGHKILSRTQVLKEDDFSDETAYEVLVPETELDVAQDIVFDIASKKN